MRLAIVLVLALANDARADSVDDARADSVDDAIADSVDDAIATGTSVAEHGCSTRVMGRPFRGAEMLCLAMTSLAVASAALADPTRAPAAVEILDRVVGRGLARSARAPFPSTSVLYRGLLGTMLIARETIAPGSRWVARLDTLAAELARDVERHAWIASYRDGYWPCDHAPALAFLRLHGRLRGDAVSTRAADLLRDRLRMLVPVFPTRVDATGALVDGDVRSTALAFAAAFALPAEPGLARELATQLVVACDRLPLAACREWRTPGHAPDAASGPIVAGYSVGATALALIATRALADPSWSEALLATAHVVGTRRLSARGVEAALLAWSTVARAF